MLNSLTLFFFTVGLALLVSLPFYINLRINLINFFKEPYYHLNPDLYKPLAMDIVLVLLNLCILKCCLVKSCLILWALWTLVYN